MDTCGLQGERSCPDFLTEPGFGNGQITVIPIMDISKLGKINVGHGPAENIGDGVEAGAGADEEFALGR